MDDFFVFPSSSFIGRSLPVEPFSFTGAIGISDGCCFGAIVAIMLGRFVFMLYSGYMVGFLLLGYIYIYIVIELYSYMFIYLYRYFAIYLLFYCMLEAWGYCFLYIYILFLFLTSTSIFIIVVAVSLSFGFLRCKGMAVLSDTKHQAMPYSAKTFPECLPQMLHIWVFQKTFYRIVWCSDSWNHHFLMHVKRLYDDEMTE